MEVRVEGSSQLTRDASEEGGRAIADKLHIFGPAAKSQVGRFRIQSTS